MFYLLWLTAITNTMPFYARYPFPFRFFLMTVGKRNTEGIIRKKEIDGAYIWIPRV